MPPQCLAFLRKRYFCRLAGQLFYSGAMNLSVLTASIFLSATIAAHADKADAYLKAQMREHRIPGLALRVLRNGKPIKTGAYGLANIELNVPVTSKSVFEIGSDTKQFTAACILLLQHFRFQI